MLTDEQLAAIWAEHGPQDPALQEAYRLGLLRAAEVCEEQIDGYHDYDDLAADIPWDAGSKGEIRMANQCTAAIRAEAGE